MKNIISTSNSLSNNKILQNILKNKPIILPVILAVLTFAVYFNSLSNGFTYDDFSIISNNYFIKDISNITSIFVPAEYTVKFNEASYRPVATISYFLTYFIWKDNPFGFHLSSIFLHIVNVILLFFIVRKIFKNETAGFVAAIIFALQPVISETIFAASFNEDILACLFMLLAFLFYLKENKSGFIFSSVFLLTALLSKEMALIFPLIILVYELIFCKENSDNNTNYLKSLINRIKVKKLDWIFYILAIAIFALLRFVVFYNAYHIESTTFENLSERIIYVPYSLFQFVKMTLFPLNLNADHLSGYPESFLSLENIIALTVFTGFIIVIILLYRKNKYISFGLSWFIVSLLPVLNIVRIFHPVAERYLYIPVIGFAILVAGIFSIFTYRENSIYKIAYIIGKTIILTAIIVFYSIIIILRTQDWKDEEHLWTKTLQTNPKSYTANNNLGIINYDRGEFQKAKEYYLKSLEIRTGHEATYNNLGLIFFRENNYNQAIFYLKKAVEVNPKYSITYSNLGLVYYNNKKYDEAIEYCKKAIALNNDSINAYNILGIIYAEQGNFKKAIGTWESALKIAPDYQLLYENIEKARGMMK